MIPNQQCTDDVAYDFVRDEVSDEGSGLIVGYRKDVVPTNLEVCCVNCRRLCRPETSDVGS